MRLAMASIIPRAEAAPAPHRPLRSPRTIYILTASARAQHVQMPRVQPPHQNFLL